MVDIELVNKTIDKIRPYIQYDGGDIEFIEEIDGIVYVRMLGACAGCMAIDATLSEGVEALLMDEVPGVVGVRLYTDPFMGWPQE